MLVAGLGTMLLGAAGRARGGDLAFDFSTPNDGVPFTAPFAATLGYSFTVNTTITVTALGIWDEGGPTRPLVDPHDVGLWTGAGNLLSTTTIPPGPPLPPTSAVSSASSVGEWLFTPITPITLTPGDYVIGAQYQTNDDDRIRDVTSVLPIPAVTIGVPLGQESPTLTFPTGPNSDVAEGYFGPNITFSTPGSVPEPSTFVEAVIAGVSGLAYGLVRKRQAQRRRGDAWHTQPTE